MDEMLLITDDPGRSRGLARALSGSLPCALHDLYADDAPACGATLLVTDLGAEAVGRLSRLLARIRGDAPLVVLCHVNSPRVRMHGIVLGATHTLCAPFDVNRLREMAGTSRPAAGHRARDDAEPLAAATVRIAAEVRSFYARVFVPDRPITPAVIDTGTQAIALAIHDTGIRDWVRAVRQVDDATHQHCLLVAGLAAAFAANLGLSAQERQRLTKAALLHDVGKIHVPAGILNKPGRLDEAETAVMRGHPEKGYRMLADQGFEPKMPQVVRSHHEMLDGSGYPDGLKAKEIPDLVRLVTICDLHAALIEQRPYKSPLTSDAAYAVLEGMTGRLEPALVGAFRPVAAFSLRTATCR